MINKEKLKGLTDEGLSQKYRDNLRRMLIVFVGSFAFMLANLFTENEPWISLLKLVSVPVIAYFFYLVYSGAVIGAVLSSRGKL